MELVEDYINFSSIFKTTSNLSSFLENWSNARNFHMRLWKNKHSDISVLFHKWIAHA